MLEPKYSLCPHQLDSEASDLGRPPKLIDQAGGEATLAAQIISSVMLPPHAHYLFRGHPVQAAVGILLSSGTGPCRQKLRPKSWRKFRNIQVQESACLLSVEDFRSGWKKIHGNCIHMKAPPLEPATCRIHYFQIFRFPVRVCPWRYIVDTLQSDNTNNCCTKLIVKVRCVCGMNLRNEIISSLSGCTQP